MSRCLRCGATSEWIEGRVANEVATALESADSESDFLSAELAACQLDAERYRWLKAHHLQTGNDSWIRTGEDLEQAVDAGRAAEDSP